MKKTRREFDAGVKAKMAPETLRAESTTADWAARHGVHPNQIYGWQRQLIENAAKLFAGEGSEAAEVRREGEGHEMVSTKDETARNAVRLVVANRAAENFLRSGCQSSAAATGTRWAVGTAAGASAVLSYFVPTHVTAVTNITVRVLPAERPERICLCLCPVPIMQVSAEEHVKNTSVSRYGVKTTSTQ
jgi:transposase